MPGNPEQAAWVQRVLGVEVPGEAGTGEAGATAATPGKIPELMLEWRDAKEAVDARIDALAAELRAFGDPDLERIADLGLFGITDKETVGLNVALMNFDRTPTQGKASAAAKVRASINAYRKAVDANNMVALLDTAPFSTRVELRATMYSALARIERALAPIA
jgi:hypothetical protein